jgi:hypothetical protein
MINKNVIFNETDLFMPAKSHSFSTKTEADTLFVESLKINERKEGRANFSWVVVQALKEYAEKRAKEKETNG